MILPTYLNNAVLSGGGGNLTVSELAIDEVIEIETNDDVLIVECC